MTDSPTLSEMRDFLEHKADPVSNVPPASGDLPKKGSRPQFKEDKVKRDGRGRFSKQAALNLLKKTQDDVKAKQNAELKRKYGLEIKGDFTFEEMRKYMKSADSSTAKDFYKTITQQIDDYTSAVNEVEEKTGRTFIYDFKTGDYSVAAVGSADDRRKAAMSSTDEGYFAVDESGDVRDLVQHMDDETLEHYGAKGMKWGVRRSDGGTSTSSKSGSSGAKVGVDKAKAVLKSKAVSTARTAYGVNSQLAAIDKRLALPGLALAAGIAVAGVAGVGLPAVAGISIGTKVFSDPTVQAALKTAASYSKTIVKEVGATKLPDMKMPNMPKVSNPFAGVRIDRSVNIPRPQGLIDRSGKAIPEPGGVLRVQETR